jgi:tetratricopeptide (TPR) repeat protein
MVLGLYYLIALAGGLISVWAHVSTKAVGTENLSFDLLFGTIYPTMLPIYWEYVRLIVWPFNLSGYYYAELSHSWMAAKVLLALIAWLVLLLVVLFRGSGQEKFWFFWFWIWLLPVSNIIPLNVYYADRYMYLPAIGLFVLVLTVLEKAFKAGFDQTPVARRNTIAAGAILVLACGYFVYASASRIPVWSDDLTFWQDTAKKSPEHANVHLNLGHAYDMRQRYAEAEKAYLASINVFPSEEAVKNLKMVRLKAAYSGSKQPAN